MGMMGIVIFADRGCEIVGGSFGVMNEFGLFSSGLCRKAQGKTCTQTCGNRRRDQKSVDCGACMGK